MSWKGSLCTVFNAVSKHIMPLHILGAGGGALASGFAAAALGSGVMFTAGAAGVGLVVGAVGGLLMDLFVDLNEGKNGRPGPQ